MELKVKPKKRKSKSYSRSNFEEFSSSFPELNKIEIEYIKSRVKEGLEESKLWKYRFTDEKLGKV